MVDLSVLAARLRVNTKSLEEFDEALRFLRGIDEITRLPKEEEMLEKLMRVIKPVSLHLSGRLSASVVISEYRIVDIIRERHNREWVTYQKGIDQLVAKLESERFKLSVLDIELLHDIADALDAECANLFRRISESR